MPSRRSQRPYNVEYYWRNRGLELHRVRVRQTGMVELLRDIRRVPCADCAGRFDPHQMDFDHRDPATKSFNVMSGRAMLMPPARSWRRSPNATSCASIAIGCAVAHNIAVASNAGGHRRAWTPSGRTGDVKLRCLTFCATDPVLTATAGSRRARWTLIIGYHRSSYRACRRSSGGQVTAESLPRSQSAISCARTATGREHSRAARATTRRE